MEYLFSHKPLVIGDVCALNETGEKFQALNISYSGVTSSEHGRFFSHSQYKRIRPVSHYRYLNKVTKGCYIVFVQPLRDIMYKINIKKYEALEIISIRENKKGKTFTVVDNNMTTIDVPEEWFKNGSVLFVKREYFNEYNKKLYSQFRSVTS